MKKADNIAPCTYSVVEAAIKLNISTSLVRKLIKLGSIPTIRIGQRRILIPAKVIADIVDGGINLDSSSSPADDILCQQAKPIKQEVKYVK